LRRMLFGTVISVFGLRVTVMVNNTSGPLRFQFRGITEFRQTPRRGVRGVTGITGIVSKRRPAGDDMICPEQSTWRSAVH
jgi:hypothetical protein